MSHKILRLKQVALVGVFLLSAVTMYTSSKRLWMNWLYFNLKEERVVS